MTATPLGGAPGIQPPGSRLARALTYPFRLGATEEDWPSTQFGRLALINVLSSAGDAMVAVALAGSVFVSVPLNAARGRTALGLVMTMLPFAVVAPFTGPAADRFRRGKRLVLFLAAAARTAAALMMAAWIHNLALFPAAFLSLVASKTHAVARSALIPAVTDRESDLVPANSRLTLGSGLASAAAAPVGAAVYAVFGSRALLDVDALVFALAASLSLILLRPAKTAPAGPIAPHERKPPTPVPLLRGAVAVGGVRAATGFLTALVAFGFRAQGAPVIWYGVVAAAGVGGNLVGAGMAPSVRRLVRSDRWLVYGSALAIAGVALAVVPLRWQHGQVAAAVLAVSTGLAGCVGKTTFDSMVQVQIGDHARARAFARFEASFQAAWVLLALVPTIVHVPLTAGFVVIAVVLAGLVVTATATPADRLLRRGPAAPPP